MNNRILFFGLCLSTSVKRICFSDRGCGSFKWWSLVFEMFVI